jgi:hypothetical protein
MSKDLGSSKKTRSAADASMLTEVHRRAVEYQDYRNYAAQQFLKPLFSAPPPTSLASGNVANLTEARIINPEYTGTSTGGGGIPDDGPGGGTVANFAITPVGPSYSELVAVDVDSSGNMYALALGGSTTTDTVIYQYDGIVGGIVSRSIWGTIPTSDFSVATNNSILIKYSPAGIPLWAVTTTGTTSFFPRSVKVDSSGNVYIVANADGTTVTFRDYSSGGGSGTSIVQTTAATTGPTDNSDVFVYKYNSSGVFQWGSTVGSTGSVADITALSTSLGIDTSGNVYFVFYNLNTSPTYTFKSFSGISEGVLQYSTFGTDAGGGHRGLLSKLNTNGVFQWVSRITRQNTGVSASFVPQGLGVDPTSSLIVVPIQSASVGVGVESFSGVVGGTITYGTKNSIASGIVSGTEGYIIGFNSNGQGLWATRVSGSGGTCICNNVNILSNVVYAAGNYGATTSIFNSANTYGGGTITVTPYGTLSQLAAGTSGWVAKYNSNGTCLGVTSISSTLIGAFRVIPDSFGSIYALINMANTASNSVTINSFVSGPGSLSPITVSRYGTTQSTKAGDTLLIKYNASLGVKWVTRVESGSGAGDGNDFPLTVAVHPTSNFVYVGGFSSNLSTATINLYNASGVSGSVIQYSAYATLSSGNTVSSGSIRSGFLVRYDTR